MTTSYGIGSVAGVVSTVGSSPETCLRRPVNRSGRAYLPDDRLRISSEGRCWRVGREGTPGGDCSRRRIPAVSPCVEPTPLPRVHAARLRNLSAPAFPAGKGELRLRWWLVILLSLPGV